jgi:acetyltransferase-like isoleucine patch superfamily enzyme
MTAITRAVLDREADVVRALDRARRAWLVGRIRLLARLRRTTLDLDIAPDLRVGRRVAVKVAPRSHLTVHIAPRCRIGDDVLLLLIKGSLIWGEDVQLRVRSSLNLVGDLWCEGGNIFSYGTIVHCSESIRLGQWAGCAEYTTIADSAHFYTEPDVCVSENTVTGRIDLGRNVFLAPRVSVNRNVTIGDFSIIGPNSVVVGDIPAGSFASGVPAKVVRPIDLPWEKAP